MLVVGADLVALPDPARGYALAGIHQRGDGHLLARTRLAKSVHDVGWAQLLRLIGENACGGTVRPPSSVAGPVEAGTHRSVA